MLKTIAVGSGKGGVGKSMVSLNIAFSLCNMGYKVGLLDADIYGSSQFSLLGFSNSSLGVDPFLPKDFYGLSVVSIESFLDKNSPVIWRGPMVSTFLKKLYFESKWGDLDYLVIDLPPGTGDISLTVLKDFNLYGVIVVTSPDKVSLNSVEKFVIMVCKFNVTILGLVENMSFSLCNSCGFKDSLVDRSSFDLFVRSYSLNVLCTIPFFFNLNNFVYSYEERFFNSTIFFIFKKLSLQITRLSCN